MTNTNVYNVNWYGPFSLLYPDQNSCFDSPASRQPGVYMWGFKYRDGYLIYGCGLTANRTLTRRLKEDQRSFQTGMWTLLDPEAMERGERVELWHGMWKGYNSPARETERLTRQDEIGRCAKTVLERMGVFLGPLPPEQRVIDRVEVAIMDLLYSCGPPFSKLPDVGMALRPRRTTERPITINSRSPVKLHCIPQTFMA